MTANPEHLRVFPKQRQSSKFAMLFPFTLPTTSSFTFSSSFSSYSHPSLPLAASTYRGVVRGTLKKHKRLPPSAQSANLNLVVSSLSDYLPYVTAVQAGLSNGAVGSTAVTVDLFDPALRIEWRPTLSSSPPGRQVSRVNVGRLEYEVCFVLSTLGMAYSLQARSALQPLFVTSAAALGAQQRTDAIKSATQNLLQAARIYSYLSRQLERLGERPPCPDLAAPTASAMASLALAEAHLLAVLKDDPYAAAVARERNTHDREWMYKAPDIHRARVPLSARLCLYASEQASMALSQCTGVTGVGGKVDDSLLKYMENLRRTARARACRFFGIDADTGGQTGTAIAWLQAGLAELGIHSKDVGDERTKGLGLSRLRREWSEKREERKIDSGQDWGTDAGKMDEIRVLEFLKAKWVKANDTVGFFTGNCSARF